MTHPPGIVELPADPGWNQLVHASRGAVRLETALGTWVLPPHRAAWVPAGVPHRCALARRTALRTLYVAADVELLAERTEILDLTPFARELVLHLVATAPHRAEDPTTRSFLDVLGATVRSLDVAPLRLPMPRSDPCRAVAARIVDDPGETATIDDLARGAGVSQRTLERAFRSEVAMTVGRWRQRARLAAALEALAAGDPIGRVAVEVGYATQSAFGAAFKAQFGCSPGGYFDRPA